MISLLLKTGTKEETIIYEDRDKVWDNCTWRQGQSIRQLYIKTGTKYETIVHKGWDKIWDNCS